MHELACTHAIYKFPLIFVHNKSEKEKNIPTTGSMSMSMHARNYKILLLFLFTTSQKRKKKTFQQQAAPCKIPNEARDVESEYECELIV
jgi:hypothetical protein